MEVILHLGAHRTGTTGLQDRLSALRVPLASAGTAVWGPERTRGGLFAGLVKRPDRVTAEDERLARRAGRAIRREIAALEAAGVARLIVSEENLIGTMLNNLGHAALYPEAPARLARIARAFDGRVSRVALSVRSHAGWWDSALAYALARGAGVPGPGFAARVVQGPGWRELVTAMRAAFPSAEPVVWPFEALVAAPDAQIAALAGGPLPPLPPVAGRRNAAPGRAALRRMLAARGDFAGAAALGQGQGRWTPFSTAERAALARRYEDDLDWLRSGAGVRFAGDAEAHPRAAAEEEGHRHDDERGLGEARREGAQGPRAG